MTAPTHDHVASGLEGVVAFATEIAEPDVAGGALRYRGVDIEDLVGRVPFEQVWGLLVDGRPQPGLPAAEPQEPPIRSGDPRVDLQAALATLAPEPLVDVDAETARGQLARASAAALSFVAQSARGLLAGRTVEARGGASESARGRPGVTGRAEPRGAAAEGGRQRSRVAEAARGASAAEGVRKRPRVAEAARGASAAERFLIEWRGEADPAHVKAIDAYWSAAAEHGVSASTFTARIVASTGADVAAALSAAVGALSGPLHGGAPLRVLEMLDEVAALGDAERWVRDALDRGERLMGFGHRVYRAEDPRARVLRRTARELGSPRVEVAEELERAALAELRARKPDRVLATNVEFWSAVVLDHAGVPPELFTPLFACARTAGWSAHVLEQKREGRLIRPTARYAGAGPRQLSTVA
jgi:citrate synthase